MDADGGPLKLRRIVANEVVEVLGECTEHRRSSGSTDVVVVVEVGAQRDDPVVGLRGVEDGVQKVHDGREVVVVERGHLERGQPS